MTPDLREKIFFVATGNNLSFWLPLNVEIVSQQKHELKTVYNPAPLCRAKTITGNKHGKV